MNVYILEDVIRTFTISWTEQDDMSSWWTYSDDAAWLIAWDSTFDDFFWYSYVLLDKDWQEVAKVTQKESWWAGKLNISKLSARWIIDWSSNSTNNVMIKFPKRWIKMTKSGSTITLSITDKPNKSWYQYYAFKSSGVVKDNLYIWAFLGTKDSSNRFRSISWNMPTGSLVRSAMVAACNAYWNNRYHMETLYTRWLINAYYMMKYWTPYSTTLIWAWYDINYWSAQTTWATNSITNATWATDTSNSWRIKLFWLEDWWWNLNESLEWCQYWTNLLKINSSQTFSSSSWITTFDKNITIKQEWWKGSIVWNNDWMFAMSLWGSSYNWKRYKVYDYTRNEFFPMIDPANILWLNLCGNGGDSKLGTRLIYL